MILKLLFFLFYFKLFEARVVDLCEELGLENISDTIERNDNNFVCFNTSDHTAFTLNILPNSKVCKMQSRTNVIKLLILELDSIVSQVNPEKF